MRPQGVRDCDCFGSYEAPSFSFLWSPSSSFSFTPALLYLHRSLERISHQAFTKCVPKRAKLLLAIRRSTLMSDGFVSLIRAPFLLAVPAFWSDGEKRENNRMQEKSPFTLLRETTSAVSCSRWV